MKKETSSRCECIILCPTNEQRMALIDTWKKAESECEGRTVDHKLHVAGSDLSKLGIDFNETRCKRVLCMTAESQEDWERVKADYHKNFKEKCKGCCLTVVAANKEEKSKKWCSEIGADCYVDLSSFDQTMTRLRSELVRTCDMKCTKI